ncbi:T9SS type A sorting domain-containing protein [Flavobacterium qiangtangense]|uniref:T9SS type A sorting domain-containing protein n=1 Tax=Flavobacterium qiangtangense TaxID=1442595 RepID=A0ABW1PNC2_9FLAO
MNKTKAITMTLLVLGLTTAHAQQSANATGGKASGSGGTVSYSVGQVAYTSLAGSNGSVSQGVQQPFEISEVLSIEGAEHISLNPTAYPNPAKDKLTLNLQNYDGSSLALQLFDLNGKLLYNEKIMSAETVINMQDYPFGLYFLKVTSAARDIKTFKIIKN